MANHVYKHDSEVKLSLESSSKCNLKLTWENKDEEEILTLFAATILQDDED